MRRPSAPRPPSSVDVSTRTHRHRPAPHNASRPSRAARIRQRVVRAGKTAATVSVRDAGSAPRPQARARPTSKRRRRSGRQARAARRCVPAERARRRQARRLGAPRLHVQRARRRRAPSLRRAGRLRARLRRPGPRRLLLVEGPRRPGVVRGTLRAGCRVAGPAAPPAPPRRPRRASGRRRARDRGELRLARDGHLEGAWNRARQAPARPRRSGRRHDRRRGVAGGPELGGAAVGRPRSPGQALGRRRSQRGAIGQADGGDRRAGRPRGEAPGVRMGRRDGRRPRPRRVEVGLRELP